MINYSEEKLKFVGVLYTNSKGECKDLFFPYHKFPDWFQGYPNIYIVEFNLLCKTTGKIVDIFDIDSYLFDNYNIKHTTTYCPNGVKYVTPYTLEFDFYYTVTKKGSLLISYLKEPLEYIMKPTWPFFHKHKYGTKVKRGGYIGYYSDYSYINKCV